MKISLGLIFFTILSTAFVYAENSFDVVYTTTGMSVTEIKSDTESMSLILSVDVSDLNGKLNIVLERSFFDSVYNRINTDFIILADGDYALFEETEINSKTRTLNITVPFGTEDIEIIGSILDDSLPIILVDSDENKSLDDVMDKAAADKAAADKAAADKAAADKDTQTQCGPGTILKSGECVLDERCGPGTVLQNGACVLDSTSVPKTTVSKGMGKELVTGVIAAIVIAGIVAVILGIMAKASQSKN